MNAEKKVEIINHNGDYFTISARLVVGGMVVKKANPYQMIKEARIMLAKNLLRQGETMIKKDFRYCVALIVYKSM